MVLQELGRYLSELEALPHVRDLDGRELLGQAIRILVRGFATGKGLSQSLIRLCWTLEKPDETASAVRQVADRLAIFFERIGHPVDIGEAVKYLISTNASYVNGMNLVVDGGVSDHMLSMIPGRPGKKPID
jgi:NAD(P)-dependent dehydrogenase (short-subunit alcohol dehydrogenase family)